MGSVTNSLLLVWLLQHGSTFLVSDVTIRRYTIVNTTKQSSLCTIQRSSHLLYDLFRFHYKVVIRATNYKKFEM